MVHEIGFRSINNSIMEVKSLSSGFDHIQSSIKMIMWWFLEDLLNLNKKMNIFFWVLFYDTLSLFHRVTTKP